MRNIVSVARLGKAFGLPIAMRFRRHATDRIDDREYLIAGAHSVESRKGEAHLRPESADDQFLASSRFHGLAEFDIFPGVDLGPVNLDVVRQDVLERAGLERIVQAGAQPISRVSLACELQRGWARTETVPAVVAIVLTSRLLQRCLMGSSLRACEIYH